jgi:hypothetical protein
VAKTTLYLEVTPEYLFNCFCFRRALNYQQVFRHIRFSSNYLVILGATIKLPLRRTLVRSYRYCAIDFGSFQGSLAFNTTYIIWYARQPDECNNNAEISIF